MSPTRPAPARSRVPLVLRKMARGAGIGLVLGVVAGLSLLATESALAQQKPYVPPPPPKPTAVAPKGDFTAGLAASSPATDTAAQFMDPLGDGAFRAKAEADAIRKAGLAIKRVGARLVLPTASGRPVVIDSVLAGSGADGNALRDYRFDALSPERDFYIVRASFLDGAELYWISRQDGAMTEVHGEARPSPDGRFLVVANAATSGGFNGVIVWERAAGKLIERFRLESGGEQLAQFRFMRWKDGRTVELERSNRGDPITCPDRVEETLVVLTRGAGDAWALQDVSTPRCAR